MEFLLTGFHHDKNVRCFEFEGIDVDRTRIGFTVGADLTLVRKYGISVQELPLLCRRLLEGLIGAKSQTLMFTEQDMVGYADLRTAARAAADLKKKAHRKVPSNRIGQAWRRPGDSLHLTTGAGSSS